MSKPQFAILRFAKYKGPEISNIESHNERTKEKYASNPDIDKSRSHLNFHLITPEQKYRSFIIPAIIDYMCFFLPCQRQVFCFFFPLLVNLHKQIKSPVRLFNLLDLSFSCSDPLSGTVDS